MMTPLEWFAFVILPAALAILALGASRLFDVFHPIPPPNLMPSTPQSLRAPFVLEPPTERESTQSPVSQTALQQIAMHEFLNFLTELWSSNVLSSNARRALEDARTAVEKAMKITESESQTEPQVQPEPGLAPDELASRLQR